MESTKTQAADKKLRDRGKRLYKNYRWTNEMYDALAAEQGYVCAACGQPPKEGGMPLVVDHKHFKIQTRPASPEAIMLRPPIKWVAWTDDIQHPNIPTGGFGGKTKAEAIARCKDFVLPYSVRGLLCPGRHGKAGHGSCNRLIGRIDNVPWLLNVVRYLENPTARRVFPLTSSSTL